MYTIKHKKADVFYREFSRKGPGQEVSHYCPGCGHGVAHNLIAEAIDDFGVKDRVIFCSPVGCSVFAYYYFDTGNIQCAHGRASAVASAIRRTAKDAVIISYQGDGDLAGIGMGNIIHTANRGENITVYFINNAIYGMTGGQMAPTTLVNQKTQTTPRGRDPENEGYPIKMAEIISTLKAPVYVERVSLADGPRVMKARRAIRKALQNQIDRKGFSFVEILSPCPINWKMSPIEARQWIIDELEKEFPVQLFRDDSEEKHPESARKPAHVSQKKIVDILSGRKTVVTTPAKREIEDQKVKIAGFGGQGVISAGIILANCAIAKGLKTTWLPSYGPEMRGGTANTSVNISSQPIGSPIIAYPNVLIALNGPSLDAFEDCVPKGGSIYLNSSMIKRKVKRKDVHVYAVPASDMAQELGTLAVANVIMLSVYCSASGIVDVDTLRKVIPSCLKRKNLVDVNMKAIDAGVAFYRKSWEKIVKK